MGLIPDTVARGLPAQPTLKICQRAYFPGVSAPNPEPGTCVRSLNRRDSPSWGDRWFRLISAQAKHPPQAVACASSLDPSCGTRGSQAASNAPLELFIVDSRSWAASEAGLGCAKRTRKTWKSSGESSFSPEDFSCFPLLRSSHPFPHQTGVYCLFSSHGCIARVGCKG